MSVEIDLSNTAWGELVSIAIEEPYTLLDGLAIWEDENKEQFLLKPFPDFSIYHSIEYIYI